MLILFPEDSSPTAAIFIHEVSLHKLRVRTVGLHDMMQCGSEGQMTLTCGSLRSPRAVVYSAKC